MIRIHQIKLPLEHGSQDIKKAAARALKVSQEEIEKLEIIRQSIDARKKPQIWFTYTADVVLKDKKKEKRLVHKLNNRNIALQEPVHYHLPQPGEEKLTAPIAVVGAGPAGLFCAYALALKGYCPLLLERGKDVDSRAQDVEDFWREGVLKPESNVQFGEGGAGTFSDGKLNTLVKDTSGRNREVLRILTEAGADPEILYSFKPHVGTDVLRRVVKNLREQIIRLGGQVRFLSQVTDLEIQEGVLKALIVNEEERIPVQAAVLALGHSARDTFEMLFRRQVPMEAKPFAVGLRIQHPQEMINQSQYGRADCGRLGAASYKLTYQSSGRRSVYSFCMCPGGYVVNASSEPGRLAVNGMSYHGRAGKNANSALIITVTPEDFPEDSPLGGVAFQRSLEEKAYDLGQGKIPVELYGDFKEGRAPGEAFGQVEPQFKGAYAFADLRRLLGPELSGVMIEAIQSFGEKIQGFDRPDSILAGIESRTSSPVRIPRDSQMESQIRGLYPCGEGAGYAGGITSAAMDGLKTAEALIRRFAPSAAAGIDGEDLSL